jgi:hypothetical protein
MRFGRLFDRALQFFPCSFSFWGSVMTFQKGMACAGMLLPVLLLPEVLQAEDKKTTTSALAPVVRSAPAPAPVARAPAPAPVVRVAPAPAPVVRAPTATVVTKPAPVVAVKPAATVAIKPAATTTIKPAVTTSAKPATTTTATPAVSAAAAARAREDAVIAAARAKTIENTRQRNKEAEAAGAKPITTSTATTTPASNIDKARNRIQSTLPADRAVRADPARKPSVVGVQASEFKPPAPKLKPSTVPPSPGTPNFPKRPANEPALTNPASR